MTKRNIWLGAIIVAILFGGWFFLGGESSIGGSTADNWTVGGNLTVDGTSTLTGITTFTGAPVFSAGGSMDGEFLASLLTEGGATTSSSTPANMTLAVTDVCDNSVLEMTPTVGNITVTFPTAAQLIADCVPNIGDRRVFWLYNATTTNAVTITLADGSGGIHLEGEGLTTVVDDQEWAEITIINLDAARYVLDVEIRQDAD